MENQTPNQMNSDNQNIESSLKSSSSSTLKLQNQYNPVQIGSAKSILNDLLQEAAQKPLIDVKYGGPTRGNRTVPINNLQQTSFSAQNTPIVKQNSVLSSFYAQPSAAMLNTPSPVNNSNSGAVIQQSSATAAIPVVQATLQRSDGQEKIIRKISHESFKSSDDDNTLPHIRFSTARPSQTFRVQDPLLDHEKQKQSQSLKQSQSNGGDHDNNQARSLQVGLSQQQQYNFNFDGKGSAKLKPVDETITSANQFIQLHNEKFQQVTDEQVQLKPNQVQVRISNASVTEVNVGQNSQSQIKQSTLTDPSAKSDQNQIFIGDRTQVADKNQLKLECIQSKTPKEGLKKLNESEDNNTNLKSVSVNDVQRDKYIAIQSKDKSKHSGVKENPILIESSGELENPPVISDSPQKKHSILSSQQTPKASDLNKNLQVQSVNHQDLNGNSNVNEKFQESQNKDPNQIQQPQTDSDQNVTQMQQQVQAILNTPPSKTKIQFKTPANFASLKSQLSSRRKNKYNTKAKDGGRTKIHRIVRRSAYDELISALQSTENENYEIDVIQSDESDANAFHYACFRGNSKILQVLYDYHETKCSIIRKTILGCILEEYQEMKAYAVYWNLDHSLLMVLHKKDLENQDTPMHDLIHGLAASIQGIIENDEKVFEPGDLQYVDSCKIMLSNGYFLNIQNRDKLTPLQLIQKKIKDFQTEYPYFFERKSHGVIGTLIDQLLKIEDMFQIYMKEMPEITKPYDPDCKTLLHMVPIQQPINCIKFVNYLLRTGVDLCHQDEDGNTVLHYAIMAMDIDMVLHLCLISNSIKMTQNKASNYSLMVKTLYPELRPPIFTILSVVNKLGESGLHICTKIVNMIDSDDQSRELYEKSLQIAKILLNFGIKINALDVNGKTALDICKNKKFIEDLVKYYPKLNQSLSEGPLEEIRDDSEMEFEETIPVVITRSETSQAASQISPSSSVSEIKGKAKKSATKNVKVKRKKQDDSATSQRKKRSVSVDSTQSKESSNTSDISKLSKKGRYPNKLNPFTTDENGRTRLHLKSRAGHIEHVKLLIEFGADVNAKDYAGYTPISEAVNNGHVEVVKLLLQNGAHVNVHGLEGETPLQEAVMRLNVDIVQLLLKYGADPFATNHEGQIARDFLKVASPLHDGQDLDHANSKIIELLDNYDRISPQNTGFKVKKSRTSPRKQEQITLDSSPKQTQNRQDIQQPEQDQNEKPQPSPIKLDSLENISNIVPKQIKQKSTTPHVTDSISPPVTDYISPSVSGSISQTVQVTSNMPAKIPSAQSLASIESHEVNNLPKIDESLLPLVSFQIQNGDTANAYLLDDYISQVLGFKNSNKMYLFFGKSPQIRDYLKKSRKPVDSSHIKQLSQIDQPEHFKMFLQSQPLNAKSNWIPFDIFGDEMIPYYIEKFDLDPLDIACIIDDTVLQINL